MAKGITKTREKSVVQTEIGLDPVSNIFEEWEFDVFHVVADTYSELITAIDEIPDETLSWWSGVWEELGIEGMPNKSRGKWRAMLRTEQIGKGKRINEYHP
jgi:hypothetical protein|tara:strand:+ start:176 stop:478 length:303 start_codon:yes stop_codon:yes gene_type:complete